MNSLQNNTTTLPQFDFKIPAFITYIILGFAGVLANLVIFVVFFSDLKLFRKSSLMFGVTCSHFICGVHLAWAGVYRLWNLKILGAPVHPWHCVVLVFPNLYPFMFQLLAAQLVLAAAERWLAFATPTWFYYSWNPFKAWSLTLVGFMFAVVSVIAAQYTPWKEVDAVATFECVQPFVFDKKYVSYYLSFAIVAGTMAVVITCGALRIAQRHIATLPLAGGEMARSKRQLRLTKVMLIICLSDFCLVVIPNSILLFGNVTYIPPAIGNYATIAYGINSVTTIFANLFFNLEFRTAALKLVGKSKTIVVPIAGASSQRSQPTEQRNKE